MVPGYDWDFAFLVPLWPAFLRGALVTLALSAISFVAGTIVGTAAGFLIRIAPASRLLFLLNDCVRAVPVLVLLFFVNYFPYQAMIGVPGPSPFWASVGALALSQAAYSADLVRGALSNVSPAVIGAARAIGLRGMDVWRFVVLPDVVRQMIPTQLAFLIGIIRLSSLASVIGTEDVVFTARVAGSQNFRSMEGWVVVGCIYIVLVLPLTLVERRLERAAWIRRRW